ncbi:MAG: MmgE/PrpD family protein [Rhodobacterales bacterium]|nr:MmgE/PrpD family protein [Rhodobacterales bacterium]
MPPTGDRTASLTEGLMVLMGRPVTEAERARAALHVLDWLGCALAGTRSEIGQKIAAMAGLHPFALAGTGSDEAVAALGALGSLLEMDDVHRAALLHPGPVILPVILGLGGADPLGALIRAYEAMIRLGAHVGPGHYAFFHNTSTCGGMGSAVAAASLMRLDGATTVSAIGHTMSLSGGLWQCRNEPVATKHLHVVEAARRGVIAARYAGAGLAGPRFILDGPQGFFAAVARDGDPAGVVASPDAPWKLHEVSFKPWPACRHAHPAIDAALALREGLGGRVPEAILVATYGDAIVFCDRRHPRTAGEARFSLQHAVAVALTDGPPPLAAFEPDNLPAYAPLRARVTVATDPAISAAYPAHFGATVSVTTGGDTLTAHVADAWGDTENPMDEAAVIAKFDRLAAWGGVPPALSCALRTAALALPAAPDTTALTEIMRTIARQPGVPE